MMNKAPSDERIELIDLFWSMTGEHCIAKDDIHPNTKRVETDTELNRSVSDEQTARVVIKELQASDSEENQG